LKPHDYGKVNRPGRTRGPSGPEDRHRLPRRLLAARLGDDAVTSIEIDATVAQQARAHLSAAGYTPIVITGDGAAGYPGGAPYDRLIATASVRPGELPYPWATQTRPGGIVVTPWGPDYHNGVMVQLVGDSNGTASGRLSGNLVFMRLRAQQDTLCPLDDGETGDAADPRPTPSASTAPDGSGTRSSRPTPGGSRTTDRPNTRLGVTVTGTEQRTWLDHPDQHVATK
jgi:Protein-L-isoaspartate(D-aspartate) O-methyltransferase (PCMT)